jgi:hypothetical protein
MESRELLGPVHMDHYVANTGKVVSTMIRKGLLVALISFVHFLAEGLCLTRAEAIRPGPDHAIWHAATQVLGFPLLYASDWIGGVDLFPLLMVANSILWGVTLVYGFSALLRMATRMR